MTVSLSLTRAGGLTRVFAESDLSGSVSFCWYLDGAYVATTTVGERDFQVEPGDQVRIEVLDTTDPTFDPIANAPAGYPARQSLWWIRSLDSDVDRYVIEQLQDAGSWERVAIVRQTADAWAFGWLSRRLVDLATYSWRVTPLDVAGNAGTPRVFGPQKVVRRPDAPRFTVAAAGGHVTFTGAS